MNKKFLTMADKVQYDIERIKSILENYDTRRSLTDNSEDLQELEDKRAFVQEQLEHHEKMYIKYKKNNDPYYEPYTYEYFKDSFSKYNNSELKHIFIREVCSFTDDILDISSYKPAQKVKILENIIKAYKEVSGDN